MLHPDYVGHTWFLSQDTCPTEAKRLREVFKLSNVDAKLVCRSEIFGICKQPCQPFIDELLAAACLRVSVQLVCCNASMHANTLLGPFLTILFESVQTG